MEAKTKYCIEARVHTVTKVEVLMLYKVIDVGDVCLMTSQPMMTGVFVSHLLWNYKNHQ